MKPFLTVATPHKDILEGRLEMDVFAADLWQVFNGEAPSEYQDSDLFFKKTYLTSGMKNLLDVVKKRLDGKGGDSVIQLQTPFGGGKTHSLIALYHKSKEWKANVIVIDGTALDPKDKTLWGEIERQLTGNVNLLKGETSPGREKLKNLLKKHQPLLILIDEILEYTTKSAGIKVGASNMASQTIAFIQELTETVKILPNSILVLTLPSSILEHYDENAERLFQQLQKVAGRVQRIYTPVQDEEVSHIIRRRLFSDVDEKSAKDTIDEFLEFAEKEKILPENVEKINYRDKFIKSFPFQPEVIDILYKRWGSFPTFQRTRGVLRLLGLVVQSLKNSKIPFIRLGDFDLKNEDIRRELINHIGQEFDGIIASDITSIDSGAKKVDKSLGSSYSPFSFGTKVATAIFMYSFSGGPVREATINEIKLSCAEPGIPSSIIVETITKLRETLYYLSDKGLFFTNQPNLNRMLLNKMEVIEQKDIEKEEKNLLIENIKKETIFDIYIWPNNSKDIPDNSKLKLIVLKDSNKPKEFFQYCGDRPRIYRNTLIFLCPLDSERINFEQSIKRKIAWEEIDKDKTLHLTEEQKEKVKEEVKKGKNSGRELIRTLYRFLLLPTKDNFKEINLGISTYGMDMPVDREVYEALKNEGEIFEKLSPLILKEKYLKNKNYSETKNILESFYKTPGEMRIVNEDVLKNAIKEGVKQGLFGLGILENGSPLCKIFKQDCFPELVEGEIIIKPEKCVIAPFGEVSQDEKILSSIDKIKDCKSIEEIEKIKKEIGKYELPPEQIEIIEREIRKKEDELKGKVSPKEKCYNQINLKLNVPLGKLADIVKMINYIRQKFNKVDVKVEISAADGEISKSEYEDKIKETTNQTGTIIESENTE
jgi:hypothetical protein